MTCLKISSNRHRFFLILLTATFTCIIMVATKTSIQKSLMKQYYTWIVKTESVSQNWPQSRKFLIDTEGCQIPYLNPMDHSIERYIDFNLPPLPCETPVKSYSTIDGDILTLDLRSMADESDMAIEEFPILCCYKSITRGTYLETDKDDIINYSECINITGVNTQIPSEFILLSCYQDNNLIYNTLHSIAQIKPEVESRCFDKLKHYSKNKTKINKEKNGKKLKRPPINVLFLGLDSVSRLNLYRHIPEAIDILRLHTDVFDMVGFNKIGDNTLPNFLAMLTGRTLEEEEDACLQNKGYVDNCNFIWKNFSMKGYRTIYGEDSPTIATFNYLRKGFEHQPTDYYFRPLLLAAEPEFTWFKRGNLKLCLGNYTQVHYAFNWLSQILKALDKRPRNRPSFAVLWLSSMTHDYLNDIHYINPFLMQFLNDSFNSNILRNTITFFLSDHGLRWGPIRQTYIGHMEERLPALFVSLPKWFKKQYPKAFASLNRNTKRLVNPLDVYATLAHLLDSKTIDKTPKTHSNTVRSVSLFRDISERRTCADIGIPEHYCTCHESKPLETNNSKVLLAADKILQTINRITGSNRSKCKFLTIKRILYAYLNEPRFGNTETHLNNSNGVAGETVTVSIETEPSNGRFEGTASFRNVYYRQINPWTTIDSDMYFTQIVGPISRINLYKNDSECTNDPILKKYCFCIEKSSNRHIN